MPKPSPVNPHATPEATALLEFIYEISGKRVLSGQHNFPGGIAAYSDEVAEVAGAYPAIWGQDFGFSEPGDKDGINFREAVMEEAIRQHEAGSIITLMWHAVRPIEEEPVTFSQHVQGKLTDGEWADLLTPGTEIHERWIRQSDVVAELLKKLRDAKIPVLWRPYHEMNGDWFWWCGREGAGGYQALYRQLYDRFVNVHELHNLIWVWNANIPRHAAKPYALFYPGADVVDILATDVYDNDFLPPYYDTLVELAAGKPVALGEVGTMPTPEILVSQPLWAWFMTWSGFAVSSHNSPAGIRRLYQDARTLNRAARG